MLLCEPKCLKKDIDWSKIAEHRSCLKRYPAPEEFLFRYLVNVHLLEYLDEIDDSSRRNSGLNVQELRKIRDDIIMSHKKVKLQVPITYEARMQASTYLTKNRNRLTQVIRKCPYELDGFGSLAFDLVQGIVYKDGTFYR